MTTACFDGETLAVSSLVTIDGAIGNNYKTLYTIGKGRTLSHAALCGEPADNLVVAEWLESLSGGDEEIDQPAVAEDFAGLVVMPSGVFELTSDLVLIPVSGNVSVGSGWRFAMAAMDFGNGAAAAVTYATSRDTGTGGDIHSVRVVSLKAVKIGEPKAVPASSGHMDW